MVAAAEPPAEVPAAAPAPEQFRVRIVNLAGTVLAEIDAHASWTAADLKRQLDERGHKLFVCQAQFVHDNTEIKEAVTLREAGVTEGSFIHVVRGKGRMLVTASRDCTAKIWSIEDEECLGTLVGHTAAVTSASFSPDGQRVLTSSHDGTAKVWSSLDGQCLRTLDGHKGKAVMSANFSLVGGLIVTSGSDYKAKVWNAETFQLLGTLRGHEATVHYTTFSPDGKLVLTVSSDGTAKLFSSTSFECISTTHTAVGHAASAAFSPDGEWVVLGVRDLAKLWSVSTGDHRELRQIAQGHRSEVCSTGFSPDGKLIVTGAGDGTAKLWSLSSGSCASTIQGHANLVFIFCAALSPDGELLVTTSIDNLAKIWRMPSGDCVKVMKGHTQMVVSARFSP